MEGEERKDNGLERRVKISDRLRWEYLRESQKYRKDWEQFKKLSKNEEVNNLSSKIDDILNIPFKKINKELNNSITSAYDSIIHNITDNNMFKKTNETSVLNLKDEIHQNFSYNMSNILEICKRYCIKRVVDPDKSYEQVMKERGDNNFLFYTCIEEYGIFEGILDKVRFGDITPLTSFTVNILMPKTMLKKEFEKIIAKKQEQFKETYKNSFIGKKFLIPKYDNLENLENYLRYYRLKNKESYSYGKIVQYVIAREKIKDDIDLVKDRIIKEIKKAKKVIQNVENGFFP